MESKNEIPEQIDSLIRAIDGSDGLLSKQLVKLAKKNQTTRKQFEKSLVKLQESLDYLRVCIKYQTFDLEATRRENEYLRHLLAGEEDEELTS